MVNFILERSAPTRLSRETRARLHELGFTQEGVERRLNLDSMSELHEASRTRQAHVFPLETPQDHLIALFIFGQPLPRERIECFLRDDEIQLLVQTGLVAEPQPGMLSANVFFFPFDSLFIASDRHDFGRADEVWIPSGQTFSTVKFLPGKAGRTLDIATGNGILAMLMGRRSERVHGIDINPRAIEFARFNAWFNELSNVSFEAISHGAFAGAASDTFDVITGVLPDLMVGAVRRPGPISRVVPDGMGLLNEIYGSLDRLLEREGVCVFWHGIAASQESIRGFFENQILVQGHLAAGFEVVALSATQGGQETGVFLVKKEASKLPPVFSRVSLSLGITNPSEVFELTDARRRFHSLRPEQRQNVRLSVREGLSLWSEHEFVNGRFSSQGCQIGRYRFSSDVFELLQLIDGWSTFWTVTQRFLAQKLDGRVVAGRADRERVEQTICDLVDRGIVSLVDTE